MQRLIRNLAVAVIALALGPDTNIVHAQAVGDRIDPKAAEIAQKAADFLASRPAFSFNWFISFDEIVDGREKITYLRSGDTVMVRGKGVVAHTERDNKLRDYYYNGSSFTVVSPNENFFATAPFEGGYDALVAAVRQRTGSILPMWSILSENLPDGLLSDIESGSYLGETLIAGKMAYHLAFSEYKEDWQVWISTDDESPLLLMLVGTDKSLQGWPQYRVYMTDWDLDPDRDLTQFTFTPDASYTRVAFPGVEAEVGTPADPDEEQSPTRDPTPGAMNDGDTGNSQEPSDSGK